MAISVAEGKDRENCIDIGLNTLVDKLTENAARESQHFVVGGNSQWTDRQVGVGHR